MKNYIGLDIGGTKCAVVLARDTGGSFEILERVAFATLPCVQTLENFSQIITDMLAKRSLAYSDVAAIGISCGGPLDSNRGVIMSPPNLVGWDDVHITEYFSKKFSVPAHLQNDANACALAEWKFGAGVGTRNMVFMTFGTGLGAGLVINSRLYAGTNGNAGEVGHIRLEKFGAVGYGKRGSFEGFCSGSGIAQAGRTRALELFQSGKKCGFCSDISQIGEISAKTIAQAADAGDADAVEIYRQSGEYLGRGISVLIDILNPERVVIGSIYERSENLLAPAMQAEISREALGASASVCEIVPAKLGNSIGDYAAISVAVEGGNGNL